MDNSIYYLDNVSENFELCGGMQRYMMSKMLIVQLQIWQYQWFWTH